MTDIYYATGPHYTTYGLSLLEILTCLKCPARHVLLAQRVSKRLLITIKVNATQAATADVAEARPLTYIRWTEHVGS